MDDEIEIGEIVTILGRDSRNGSRIQCRGIIRGYGPRYVFLEITSGPDDGRTIKIPRQQVFDARDQGLTP